MLSKCINQKLQLAAPAALTKITALPFKKGLCLVLLATALVTTTSTFAANEVPSLAQVSLQSRVKAYAFVYGRFLLDMYTRASAQSDIGDTVYVGALEEVQGNRAWLHGYEVTRLVSTGKLDACCWRATPAKYQGLVSATSAQVSAGASVPNPAGGTFTIPAGQKQIFSNLIELMDTLNSDSRPYDPAIHLIYPTLNWEFLFNSALISGHAQKNSVMDKLIWTYSYVNLSFLKPQFKNYYSFACVLCYDAGFYDLRGLYNTNKATGKPYYDGIITPANLPLTYSWLINRFKRYYSGTPFNGNPPPQLSMGPTFQGKAASAIGKLDDAGIYPVHCHQAQEVYFALDPLNYSKLSPQGAIPTPGITLETESYYIGHINTWDKFPVWQADMSSQFPGNYIKTPGANIIYNRPRAYHSMHAGKVSQFTTWARLTRPEEGTYFPLNDPKKPHPKEGGCSPEGVAPDPN